MRLFGTFKSIEVYLIVTAIFLLYSFNQLCEKREVDMVTFFPPQKLVNHTEVDPFVKNATVRRPLPDDTANVTLDDNLPIALKHPPQIYIPYAPTLEPIDDVLIAHEAVPQMHPSTVAPQPLLPDNSVNVTLVEDFVKKPEHPAPIDKPTTTPPLEGVVVQHGAAIDFVIAPPVINRTDALHPIYPSTGAPQRSLPANAVNVTLDDHVIAQKHIIDKPSTPPLEGVILPTDAAPDVIIAPGAIPPVYFSTLAPQPIIAPEKQVEAGLWNNIIGLFGGAKNVRVKRDGNLLHPDYNKNIPLLRDQTYLGTYRCERARSLFAHINPFIAGNLYQQMFGWRFWGIVLLSIHLILILYHSFVNMMHRVPTSQRFNRVFAFLGLIIWELITLWIVYQLLLWNHKFMNQHAPIFPSVPSEFYAFLILSFAMNIILLYELVTPMTFFLSYDITPRHPRRGYVPAAQSENEYISGIIRKLEAAPEKSMASTKNRPVIRTFENDMV